MNMFYIYIYTKPRTLNQGNGGGVAVVALYDYHASPDKPFSPDPHDELELARGDVLFLLHKREVAPLSLHT